MEFAVRYKKQLIDWYTKELLSTYVIAEKISAIEGKSISANKIRLALEYLGIPRRNYKDAQKISLDSGRSEHPTKGKALTTEHKRKVGTSRAKAWSELSDQERERLSNLSKAQWAAMTDSERANLRDLAAKAVRESSKEGSMTERFVAQGLRDAGFTVQFHLKGLIANSDLEVDLFLPELKVAIEIDGPAHFLPIWGEESLQKHQAADAQKEGLLLDGGYVLIRVKQLDKNMSVTRMEKVLDAIQSEIAEIVKKFPPKTQRIIELELKNGKITK